MTTSSAPTPATAIERKIANLTLNGSTRSAPVTETLDAMAVGRAADYTQMVSYRSGETADTT